MPGAGRLLLRLIGSADGGEMARDLWEHSARGWPNTAPASTCLCLQPQGAARSVSERVNLYVLRMQVWLFANGHVMQQLFISKNSSFTGKHTPLNPPSSSMQLSGFQNTRSCAAITTVSHNTFPSPLKETHGQSAIPVSLTSQPQQRFSYFLSLWIHFCGIFI